MASIDSISISGIRSFDPNPRNGQTIHFKKPLTVILGKNGAGKTTVIEALLNSCTGVMPPGSAGTEKCSFIYDPKVVGGTTVKAKIKLDVTAKDGSKVTVVRNLEASKKGTKVSFATLDSVIQHQDPATGKHVSQSYRASDCDSMVPEFLGVSKAVLEHVIFCHQEDSNWPLQAPSDVKAKLDDIFASAGYVAALDKLREEIKIYKGERDKFEISMREAKGKKEDATKLREAVTTNKKISQSRYQQSREAEPKIKQISVAIDKLDKIAHEADEASKEIATLQGRIEEKERSANDIAARVKISQRNTIGELHELRGTFPAQMKEIQDQARQAEAKLHVNREARQKKEQLVQQLRIEKEVRSQRERDHKRRVLELKEILAQFSDDAFVLGEAAFDEKALARVEKKLMDDLNMATATNNSERQNADAAAKTAKDDLDTIYRELDAVQPERQMYEEKTATTSKFLADKRQQLARGISEGNSILQSANVPQTIIGESFDPGMPDNSHTTEDNDNAINNMNLNSPTANGNTDRILLYLKESVADLEQRIEAANATRRAGTWHKEEERLVAELNAINNTLQILRTERASRSAEAEDTNRLSVIQEQIQNQTASFNSQLAQAITLLQLAQQQSYEASRGSEGGNSAGARSLLDVGSPAPHNNAHITPSNSSLATVSFAFDTLRSKRETELQASHEATQAADRNAAIVNQKLAQKREELADAERQLMQKSSIFKSAQQNYPSLIGPDATAENFSKIVSSLHNQLMECKQGISSLVAMKDCYEAFISTAKTDHKCAVCDRGLSGAEMASFVHYNEERHKTAPQQLIERNKQAQFLEKALTDLRQLEPVVGVIAKMSEVIPALRNEVANLTQQQMKLSQQHAELSARHSETEAAFRSAQTFVTSNMAALSSRRDELSSLALQEQAINARLQRIRDSRVQQQQGQQSAANYSSLSLQQIEHQHASCMDEMNKLTARLQDIRREKIVAERGTHEDPLKAELQAKQKAQFALEPLIRQCREHLVAIRDGTRTLSEANSRIRHLAARRTELQAQLDMAKSNLEKAQANAKRRVEAAQTHVIAAEKNVQTVQRHSVEVKTYIANGEGRLLDAIRDRLMTAEAEVTKEVGDLTAIEAQIRDCNKVLDHQQQAQSNIDLHIEYHTALNEAKRLRELKRHVDQRLAKLKDDTLRDVSALLGSLYDPMLSVQSLRSLLQRKQTDLEKEKAHHLGNIEATELAIQEAEAKLAEPNLHQADDIFKSTFVQLHTSDLVVKDLEKYYTALEKAIQSYHQEKIQRINELIAEYWRQTYRGSDIDSIEIRAEDEVNAAGTIRSYKYKYRVVMRKGPTELDMRGRCSAGQKVLASVVIRLALSEAFCCDCGVLALDEPTTNLDEDNARSLARALKDLIDARRHASNFQLVVITHDETFVRELGGQNVVDSFYFVHKDRAGAFSLIEELPYERLVQ